MKTADQFPETFVVTARCTFQSHTENKAARVDATGRIVTVNYGGTWNGSVGVDVDAPEYWCDSEATDKYLGRAISVTISRKVK